MEDLKNRFRAPGDFDQAYGVALEGRHPVQILLGVEDKVQIANNKQIKMTKIQNVEPDWVIGY